MTLLKKSPILTIFVLVVCIISCHSSREGKTSQKVLRRISFGSCASQEKPQPLWENIVNKAPELFFFIGDNIYADTEDTMVIKAKYAKLAAIPGYRYTCKRSGIGTTEVYVCSDCW